jgi:hypothetical protein
MGVKRIVTADEIEHLPTELHRKIAWSLIRSGIWTLAVTQSGVKTEREFDG